MLDAIQVTFIFLIVCIFLFGLTVVLITRSVKREIDKMLDEAGSQSEKDEIRLKLVKTFYPPRFNRD